MLDILVILRKLLDLMLHNGALDQIYFEIAPRS